MKKKLFSFNFHFLSFLSCLILPILLISPLHAHENSPDETLFVRRILSFWDDQEYDLVRAQINLFHQTYPQSTYSDRLWQLLGDLEYSQKRYTEASTAYSHIKSPETSSLVLSQHIDSLYQSRNWDGLIRVIQPLLPNHPPDEQRLTYYYGEALLSKEQYEEAKNIFEQLLGTSYRDFAIIKLAEVHQGLNHPKRAAELYLSLVESSRQDLVSEEDLLFKAAALQMSYDKEQAIQTLARAGELKGKNSSTAVESQLGLLFDAGKYQEIIRDKEKWKPSIPSERHALIDLYVSQSYFALQHYQEALDQLKGWISDPKLLSSLRSSQQKAALMTYIASAYHLHLPDEIDFAVTIFEKRFREDPDLVKALYWQALTNEQPGRYAQAQTVLNRLLKEFPSDPQRDTFLFESLVLLFKQHQWSESREKFLAYAKEHPDSPLRLSALHYASSALQQQIQEAQNRQESAISLQEQLLADLSVALDDPTQAEQKPQHLLQTANVLCELKRFPQALEILHRFLQDYPIHPNVYQAHVLLALCYEQEEQPDLNAFIAHAEHALELNPQLPEKASLHLHLFKAYFQLAHNEQEMQPLFLQKAADSLYEAYIVEGHSISPDYALWLANTYNKPLQKELDTYLPEPINDTEKQQLMDRSLRVFEKALDPNQFMLTLESLSLETELYKLSCLYAWQNKRSDQILVLERLLQQQQSYPEWPWKLQSRVLLALAGAYEATEQPDKALNNLKEILKKGKGSDPYLLQLTKLHHARLQAKAMSPEQKTLSNPDVQNLLGDLKDLQIRKFLPQEPLHLEAAIDYAFLRSSLEPKEKQAEQLRSLLLKTKADFMAKDTIWAKDYLSSRERYPEKEWIFQAYMLLIDAHIAAIEAKIAQNQGKTLDAKQKQEAAQALYQTLKKNEFAVSKYLTDQAQWHPNE